MTDAVILLLLLSAAIPISVLVVLAISTKDTGLPRERDVIYIPYDRVSVLLLDAPSAESEEAA